MLDGISAIYNNQIKLFDNNVQAQKLNLLFTTTNNNIISPDRYKQRHSDFFVAI